MYAIVATIQMHTYRLVFYLHTVVDPTILLQLVNSTNFAVCVSL
jgi:hypothetical protein